MFKRPLAFAAIALAAGLVGLGTKPAAADVVTAGSTTLEAAWTYTVATGETLSGDVQFSNFAFTPGTTSTTFTMNVFAENTTAQGSMSLSDWQSVRLTAFGFDTNPAGTASGNSSVFNIYNNENFPSVNQIDVCASSGNSCSGGGSGGLYPSGSGLTPTSDTFTLTIEGLPLGATSIDLGTNVTGGSELFDVKFQTGFGSFELQNAGCFVGEAGCGTGGGTTPVPEPSSLSIMGFGFAALGLFFAWRRRVTGMP